MTDKTNEWPQVGDLVEDHIQFIRRHRSGKEQPCGSSICPETYSANVEAEMVCIPKQRLVDAMMLVGPPDMQMEGGRVMRFVAPNAAELYHALSERVRALTEPLSAEEIRKITEKRW